MTTLTKTRKSPVAQETFLQLVEKKLASMKTPGTLEEMDQFKERGGAVELKEGLNQQMDTEVAASKGTIHRTLDSPPPPPAKRKPTPLGKMPATPRSARLDAASAAPAPRAEEEVTLEPSREAVEADLARHRLTKERLEKANDPRFSAAQKAREHVHEHADRAPAQFRGEERATLAVTRRQLAGDEIKAGAGMRTAHTVGQATARLHQSVAILREAEERRRVAGDIEAIYLEAEKTVRGKLDWLAGKDGEDGEVDRRFDRGEKSARDNFEDFVDEEMSSWKLRRYGGRALIPLIGGAIAAGTWVYDKLAGIDDHPDVIKIFDDGRELYLSGLKITIRAIATLVETTLGECEKAIADAERKIRTYIAQKGLSPSLRKVAKDAAASVFERFGELREDVSAKREELADRLVDRYRESQEAIDQRIKELQAENRGLVEKFVDKLKEIVQAIRNFRNKIGPILAEAGDVIDEIIDDPIGFLGNLLDAVKKGFNQFKSRIDEHLKKGVISWLFGTLASAGVQVPKDFSLRSIGGLILEVLGLTFEKLKARAMRMVGPRAAGVIEKVGGYLGTLFREGPAGLWAEIQEEVGDLKEKVLEEVKSWVITRIVTSAVKKLAMMFNPVGAIVQAVITIYHVIMFFLENIERILELVRTVVRSAVDVVRGRIQAAADKIEQAMAMTVPLILSFLARLLGLGGIAQKVRSVIARFKSKVERAVTKFLRKLVAKFKSRFTAKGTRRRRGEKAPTSDPAVRERRKREALRDVRQAMRAGVARARLQALLKRLRGRLKLKRAVLTTGHDVEIENSGRETVKGDVFEASLGATVGTTKTPKGKLERKKTPRGGLRLGKFTSRAPGKPTVRGVLETHVTAWPYPDMPSNAPRPLEASAELYGQTSHLKRVSTPGSTFTGELGNVEALIRHKTPDYDAGHLIANEFGGREGFENLTPMRATFNRKGPYRKLEEFLESKLPPATKAKDPEVAVTMTVRPVYPAPASTTVGDAAHRIGARLKGLAKRKAEVEAAGKTWRGPKTGVDVGADVAAVEGDAGKTITVPPRIPTEFGVSIRFKTKVDPADTMNAADREKLDRISKAPRGRAARPKEGPLIVLEELAPKTSKTGMDEGAAAAKAKDAGGPRVVTAEKTFTLPHVKL